MLALASYAPLAAFLVALQGGGERPLVTVEIQPATVAVGQPFVVRLRVRAAAGATVRFPSVPDSSGSIEAVDPRAIEDHSTRAVFDQTAVFRFVAWEPGHHPVPLAGVRWEQPRTSEVLAVGAIAVDVTSALPADTTEQDPRDARAPFDPPPGWWRWLVGALALFAVAWMAWKMRRRRQFAPAVPDAFVDAQAAFSAIDQLALDDAGEPGRAVLAYAEVMREYLTRRFPAATEGLTTPEFVQALADNALPILPEEVLVVLERADAVKFAGAAVDAESVRLLARASRSVVRDVQTAYEVRLAAADKGPPRRRRRGRT